MVVGRAVGEADGETLGRAVGDVDGETLGRAVGDVDGNGDGEPVGTELLGAAVGASVGSEEVGLAEFQWPAR